MPFVITFCQNCTQNNPQFLQTVENLQREYADDICIVELDCMAACDVAPAVMLDDAYYPSITPHDLDLQVHERIDVWQHITEVELV